VLSRYASRSAVEVVQRHLDAVGARDVAAMAGDYALDAVLVRGESHYRGWYAIADYFDDALIRLGGRSVEFGRVRPVDDGTVETDWSISAGLDGEPATGRDTFTVVGGRIAHQIVRLDGRDF
jgi:hypothetical protein